MKLLALLLFFSGILVPNNDFKWPEEWTSDMSLSVYYYGGMTPETWKVNITKSTCTYEKRDGSYKHRYDFYPTTQELKNLIHVMKSNHLTKIKSEMIPDIIQDKATSGFTFKAGDKIFSVNSGATVEIEERWRDNAQAIEDSVMALVHRHMEKQKITVLYKIDSSVQHAKRKLHIFVEHAGRMMEYEKDSIPDMVEQKVLPGEYHLHAYLTNEKPDLTGSKMFSEVRTAIDTRTAREYLFKFDGKKLTFEPK